MAISPSRLTFAQRRVALLLLEGHTAPEMRDTLGVSVSTVRTHLRVLHQKADKHSLPALIRWAWENAEIEIVPVLERDPAGLVAPRIF